MDHAIKTAIIRGTSLCQTAASTILFRTIYYTALADFAWTRIIWEI